MNNFVDKRIRFIGCGGAGMVGVAKIALEMGARVSGSDMVESANTRLLTSLGADISIGHDPNVARFPAPDLIVRSSAVADDNPEFAAFAAAGVPSMRRGEFLAEIADEYDTVVAVAGSHGKTSVTALLTHILKRAGRSPGFMIGGKVNGWPSSASAGADRSLFITESDESDGTQVFLKPRILVLTNVEDDHSWSVGGAEALFANFAALAERAEIVLCGDRGAGVVVPKNHPDARFISHRVDDIRDFRELNADIAVEAAAALGVEHAFAAGAAASFPGVARRMSVHFEAPELLLVEDYAHHPTEVRSALSAIRSLAPDNHLKVLFQPHRYARLAKYLDEFARELRGGADEVVVAPVFAAWSECGKVDSADLAAAVGEDAAVCSSDWQAVASAILAERPATPMTLAVLGAGDIDGLVAELLKLLNADAL